MKVSVLVGLAMIFLVLSACESVDERSRIAVTVDTNAYHAAYRKANEGDWLVILQDNINFLPKTITFAAEVGASYQVVFACPAQEVDLATEVHIYYTSSKDMSLLNFLCRKPVDDLATSPMSGRLEGVVIADATNTQGEIARVALADNVTIEAWEAYAAMVRSGFRDVVSVRGMYAGEGVFEPKEFFIFRNLEVTKSSELKVFDVDFLSQRTKSIAFSAVESHINITGADSSDDMQADVSFFSRNKTRLVLEKSTSNNFAFLPVPLQKFTEELTGGGVDSREFHPEEGHIASASIKSASGLLERRGLKFFSESPELTHDLHLPKTFEGLPEVSSEATVGGLQKIALNWGQYQDEALDKVRLYQWLLKGVAAEYTEDKKPALNIEKIEWHVTVTQSWLEAAGKTTDNLTLVLPPHFDGGSGVLTKEDRWRKEWGFRPDTAVSWEMSAVMVNADSTTDSVVDYLLNKTITAGLAFSQVYSRSE